MTASACSWQGRGQHQLLGAPQVQAAFPSAGGSLLCRQLLLLPLHASDIHSRPAVLTTAAAIAPRVVRAAAPVLAVAMTAAGSQQGSDSSLWLYASSGRKAGGPFWPPKAEAAERGITQPLPHRASFQTLCRDTKYKKPACNTSWTPNQSHRPFQKPAEIPPAAI